MPRPNGYLLDTNIIVALARDNDLGKYLERTYYLTTNAYAFHIAVVAVGESRALSLMWGWGPARCVQLESILALFMRLDISPEVVLNAYSGLDAGSFAIGIKMGKNDLWIAAVAQVYDLTLLTTDNDFDHLHAAGLVDVEWVDPNSK